jgi:hypothetical protein
MHIIFGLLLFVAFLVTGRLLRADFPDKAEVDAGFRMLARSRHIYILFSALLHLGIGTYLRPQTARLSRAFQEIGSAVLLVASGLIFWAFFAETYQYHAFSDISRYGIYASLAGVALHLLGGLAERLRERP